AVIGLPTLGLGVAGTVARGLGLDRYIPLGYSRKFWYDDTLSTLISSITSPDGEKRVFLDPNLLPLIKGRKVVIVDDAVSSELLTFGLWITEYFNVNVLTNQPNRQNPKRHLELPHEPRNRMPGRRSRRADETRWEVEGCAGAGEGEVGGGGFESPVLRAVEGGGI
ncbi:hypothetical protein LAWI1_G008253, partial [Lachnellula willkommii]